MNIIDYLNTMQTLVIKGNDPECLVARHLQRKKFRAVVQMSNEGRFLDYSYITNGFYFAEFHDDGHFYFWIEPENPLIDVYLTNKNYYRIKGLITTYLKKC